MQAIIQSSSKSSEGPDPVPNQKKNPLDSLPDYDAASGCILVDGRKNSVYRVDDFTRAIHRYKVVRAVSPFEFYVIREEDMEPYERVHKTLAKMQTYFEVHKALVQGCQVLVKPVIHSTYATWYEATQKWHRVRLVDYDSKAQLAYVFFFDDHMQLEWIPMKNLRTLHVEFANASYVPMYRAHLYDIIPIDGSHIWPFEVCEWFKTSLQRNNLVFRGLQMSWSRRDLRPVNPEDKYQFADPIIDVGMVLFKNTETLFCSLNWKMIMKGYAKPIGIGATSYSMLYISKIMPKYNFTMSKEISAVIPDCQDTIHSFAAERMCQVTMVYLRSPHCIYVHNLNKIAELKALEMDLHKAVAEIPQITEERGVVMGQAVVFCGKDQTTNESKCYRAVVLEIEEKKAQIILVDYGNTMKLKYSRLHEMPKEFASIPSYAHRIHLKTIKPLNPSDKKWSKKSINEFNKLIWSMEQEMKPKYFVFRSDINDSKDVIDLHKVHQDLVFKQEVGKWNRELFKGIEMFVRENYLKIKENPLLAPHLVSFGADILYMKNTYQDVLWKIHYLVDDLVVDEGRFEIKLNGNGDRFDKQGYYQQLRENLSKNWIWAE